jgi:hypothetical protein
MILIPLSEISSQNHPNPTTRFNKPSYPNTQTPKHLVPCLFLRRKRHCVKGSKCDFSHCVDSKRPLQFGPRGFPSPFREPSPYPGPLFPRHLRYLTHALVNHSYVQPFIQPLQTLQPLMICPREQSDID